LCWLGLPVVVIALALDLAQHPQQAGHGAVFTVVLPPFNG